MSLPGAAPRGDVPDVLALPLDEARAILEAAGYSVAIEETRPPGNAPPSGPARVVRQRIGGAAAPPLVVITVTHERFEPVLRQERGTREAPAAGSPSAGRDAAESPG